MPVALAALTLTLAARAAAQDWTYEIPKGAVPVAQDGITGYAVGGEGVVLLFPARPSGEAGLRAAADAFLAEVTAGKERVSDKGYTQVSAPDGVALLRVFGLAEPGSDTAMLHAYLFREAAGQLGVVGLVTGGTQPEDLMRSLVEARFTPGADGAALSSAAVLARAEPSGGRVASREPAFGFDDAYAAGLDPEATPLPDAFDCYEEEARRPARMAADGVLTVRADGGYAYDDGTGARAGSWARTGEGDGELRLEGPLTGAYSDGETRVRADRDGQSLSVTEADGAWRDLLCLQRGPAAEAHRLALSRAVPQPGKMACTLADGSAATLRLTADAYALPAGGGTMTRAASYDYGRWHGETSVEGGPWDGAELDYEEGDDGARTLTATRTLESRRAFSVATRTDTLAACRGRGPARPSALYGPAPAPPAPGGGGIEGLHYTMRTTYQSGAFGTTLTSQVPDPVLFTADGLYAEADPDELGELPDCARRWPNGAPTCLAYEREGDRLRLEEAPGRWGPWEPFARTEDGFEAGGEDYVRMPPLTGLRPDAVYTAVGGSVSGGGVFDAATTTSTWSSRYAFTAGGRFETDASRTSNTYLGGGSMSPAAGVLSGGGSTSDARASGGTYAFEGHWLVLTYDDGRAERLFVHDYGSGWRPGAPVPDYLTIDGDLHSRVGKDE